MRTLWKAGAVAAVLSAAWYVYGLTEAMYSDDLEVVLEAWGFYPLHPPIGQLRLGSLYMVDKQGHINLICEAEDELVHAIITKDETVDRLVERTRSGNFSLVSDIAKALTAKLGSKYESKAKMSIARAEVLALPLSKDGDIQTVLMSRPSCRQRVEQLLGIGKYVCQAQSAFVADVHYNVEDGQAGSAATALRSDQIKQALKQTVQLKTGTELHESDANSLDGFGLVFGARLDPVCVTPAWARFTRTPPRGRFDAVNFLKYAVVEPLLAKPSTTIADAR